MSMRPRSCYPVCARRVTSKQKNVVPLHYLIGFSGSGRGYFRLKLAPRHVGFASEAHVYPFLLSFAALPLMQCTSALCLNTSEVETKAEEETSFQTTN